MSGPRILYHHRIRADDGGAVHVRELISALRARGAAVEECAIVKKASGDRAAVRAGLWKRLALPRAARECLEIAYSQQGRRRLVRAGRAFRPDFVYERHALHLASGLEAARSLGVPLLLEVNAPFCDEMAQLGLLRFPARARRTERAVLAGADRVLCVTRVLADRAIELGAVPERVVVIPNAADPARYDAGTRRAGAELRRAVGIPEDRFVLGFIGHMRAWHRLDLAVEILARPGLERLHLWLVGDGPARDTVLAHALSAGVRDRVHVAGAVRAEDLPPHVCAFDAALIPAINGYASPLKLFDSLAAGVATIAPRQDNLREVLRDGVDSVLFEPGDGDSLARAVAELAADPERAAAIGRAGRESLVSHDRTWDGNARRVIAAFDALRPTVEAVGP